jgi:lipoprotein-anchoring transpeptidase ErfK/SrfK
VLRGLRPALIGLGVVVTFAAPATLGSVATAAYEAGAIRGVQADIARAHSAFGRQVIRMLVEGTPKALLDLVVADEARLYAAALPAQDAFVDLPRLRAYQQRAQNLRKLGRQAEAVEVQVEADLHQQLIDALKGLTADVGPAQGLGLATSDYENFAATMSLRHKGLSTPNATRDLIARVEAEDKDLKDATDARRAAIQALNDAQADARRSLHIAQATLARAQAFPVLKLDTAAAAIDALASRLQGAVTTAEYQEVAAGSKAQTASLAKLLQVRSEAYTLRDLARNRLQRAQQGGLDVSAEGTELEAASAQLDAAPDLNTINGARDRIQAVKNSIDVKYNLAVYGPGRVIVISLRDQELEALQDGVVLQDTIITSGRPALPTPVGNWTVTAKYSPYHFVSPWPKGSPYYYNPSWVNQAMLFHDDGYFVHDAPWRTHYGPGSDSEFGGTHGCVNVPATPMNWLYGWAPIGTPVDVVAGGF